MTIKEFVRGKHLDYTGSWFATTVRCPNCRQVFEVTETHPAYVWLIEPDEEVLGPLCPACTMAKAAEIRIDNTLVFVARGNGTLHFEPVAQRAEGEPSTPSERALLNLHRAQHSDAALALDDRLLAVVVEPENQGTAFPCVVCGTQFVLPFASAVAYYGFDRLGDLCPQCLAAGPDHWPSWQYVVEVGAAAQVDDPLTMSFDIMLEPPAP